MLSEDLYLSVKEVRVVYRFSNKSDRDVVTTVAFPMPDIPLDEKGDIVSGFSDGVQFPNDEPQNSLGFTTRANEQLVKTQVEQKIVKDAQTISYWQKIVDGVHGV